MTEYYDTDDTYSLNTEQEIDRSLYYQGEMNEGSVVSKNTDDMHKKKKKKNKYLREDTDKERKPGMYTIKRLSVREVYNKRDGSIMEEKYTKKIDIFETSTQPGKIILNAATGYPFQDEMLTPYRVGTKNEFLLFKVKYAALENKIPPCTLYFASPEQYERHMACTLDLSIKQKWNDRYNDINFKLNQKRIYNQ
jgi:hypothetical protein